MGSKIKVLIAQGLDVPNFFKNVPNFFKDVPNFVKDVPNFIKNVPNFVKGVPRGPKSVPKWETTSNHFLRLSKGINGPWERR